MSSSCQCAVSIAGNKVPAKIRVIPRDRTDLPSGNPGTDPLRVRAARARRARPRRARACRGRIRCFRHPSRSPVCVAIVSIMTPCSGMSIALGLDGFLLAFDVGTVAQ